MTNFSMELGLNVKQIAKDCVNYEFIRLVGKGESKTITDEEKLQLDKICEDIKDPYGMWYISDMIWRVEHALADNREPLAKLAACDICSTISKESYWENIFKNDLSSIEAQNIKKLQASLEKLIKL